MTTTYDPFHPKYLDESDLRDEIVRVYDLCHGCRLCFKFCSSFPTMFEAIDRHDDQDAAKLTTAEQDQVVEECFNCKLCYINCPYTPGQHEWELDFPRLMLRAKAVLDQNHRRNPREAITHQAVSRTDLAGKVNVLAAPVVNKALGTPNSALRKVVAKTVGIAAERVLPPYARQRFTTWFRKRADAEPNKVGRSQGEVALFPTCIVEYQDTGIGQDLVKVLERNGVACSLPEGQRCCGAPFLHEGDIENFRKLGAGNVQVLADAIRSAQARGEDPTVVVPQPTCGYVLKHDYPDYLAGEDAKLVAEHTMDATEYLWNKLHKGEETELNQEFEGCVPEAVTYHAPCHLRAQNIGYKSRDLLKLTGAKVAVVAECSGVDGGWGLKAQNIELAVNVSNKMGRALEKAGTELIAGDCRLANGAIIEQTGTTPSDPVQVLARAYGIAPEPGATSH